MRIAVRERERRTEYERAQVADVDDVTVDCLETVVDDLLLTVASVVERDFLESKREECQLLYMRVALVVKYLRVGDEPLVGGAELALEGRFDGYELSTVSDADHSYATTTTTTQPVSSPFQRKA
jgi:hypothetical protein